jgi:chromatin remodeling complex protein RSC6
LELHELVQPDDALSAVVGRNALPRSEMIRRLWDYIRRHDLQDRERKMYVHADEKLKALFNGKALVSVVELLKLTSAHLSQRVG